MDTHIGENPRQNCSIDKPTKAAKRRDRRSFTPEFKAEVLRLGKAGDHSIERLAKNLNLTETALRD